MIRRYGALDWAIATVASWVAGLFLELGEGYAPLAIAAGATTPVLYLTGAYRYAGQPLERSGRLVLAMIPILLAGVEWS